jgi:hypothetical protein
VTRLDETTGIGRYNCPGTEANPAATHARLAQTRRRHLSRSTTQMGKPFVIGEHGIRTAEDAVRLYRQWLPGQDLYRQLPELTGHDLMCFCPLDRPCHADVLLELANP